MKVVEASYKVLDRRKLSALEKIEHAARLAYKSEDKITKDSAQVLVSKILEREHYPVLEFSNIHVRVRLFDTSDEELARHLLEFYKNTSFFKYLQIDQFEHEDAEGYFVELILSGTVRAFLESLVPLASIDHDSNIITAILTVLQQGSSKFPFAVLPFADNSVKPTETQIECSLVDISYIKDLDEDISKNHAMVAVHFICSRAVTHELVRHRPCTFIQESQRFCNYSAAKFGREITFIKPAPFFDEESHDYQTWVDACYIAEQNYFGILENNSPQAARTVLPNSCKTEIIIYATIAQWEHIFKMRCASDAEPSMRELMVPLKDEFFNEENKVYWE